MTQDKDTIIVEALKNARRKNKLVLVSTMVGIPLHRLQQILVGDKIGFTERITLAMYLEDNNYVQSDQT